MLTAIDERRKFRLFIVGPRFFLFCRIRLNTAFGTGSAMYGQSNEIANL